nr:tRNA (guanine(46)-N(7))-methyltransferase TrmB [Sphingomonas xinjiangensis]
MYGRRQGHKLRAGQSALVEELLPRVSVAESGSIDSVTLFGDDRPLEFEIGFGGGEHLAGQAAMRPDHGLIGCEPFLNGVVGALNHIRDDGLANVRLHMGDALEVLERLPDASLTRVYLLHPDPWRKARHAKRRMMNHGPLDLIARKLKPGCEFRLGTDDPTYCRWSMMVMNQRRDFVWQAQSAEDFLVRPTDWPETRYERKARRQGHEVWYFRYLRT